jgi:hypothetical protein
VEHEKGGRRERGLSFSEVTRPWHVKPLPGAGRGQKIKMNERGKEKV